MIERPILFNGDMVRAILGGRKTQTRRVIAWKKIARDSGSTKGKLAWSDTFQSWGVFEGNGDDDVALVSCPFGKPGDRLWVRETWSPDARQFYPFDKAVYRADNYITENDLDGGCWVEGDQRFPFKWRPSIHMPRWASRITLEITNVRVERLQEISEEDCCAEVCVSPITRDLKRPKFQELWQKIKGAESWRSNPWLWVIEFKKITPAKSVNEGKMKMPKDKIKIWIDELRSGKWKQGKFELQKGDSFCCLGVAVKCFAPKYRTKYDGNLVDSYPRVWNGAPKWLEKISEDMNYRYGLGLVEMNDDLGATFDEIADMLQLVYIEGALE